jgi:hypothetical protein
LIQRWRGLILVVEGLYLGTIHQLDIGHRGLVAGAVAALEDTDVTAGAILVARAKLVEQLADRTWNRPEQEFRQRVYGFFKLCQNTRRTFRTAPQDAASVSMLRSRRKALIAAYQQCAKVAGRLPFDRLPEGSRQSVDAFMNALWVLSFRLDTTLRTRIEELADGSQEPERGASLPSAMADQFGALEQTAGKAPATGELRPELVLEENEAYVRALRQAVAEQETRPRSGISAGAGRPAQYTGGRRGLGRRPLQCHGTAGLAYQPVLSPAASSNRFGTVPGRF